MITFYPGPSKIYPEVAGYLQEAFESGLLSMNHRSKPFMDLLEATVSTLKYKLQIPDSYEVYFTSSATECWEIVAQSLVSHRSIHLFNGAFGQKWAEYTARLQPRVVPVGYGLNEQAEAFIPPHEEADLLCLTHNETSNGTALPDTTLNACRQAFKGLIAVDATSSMAGVALDWHQADVWFASVQKCFGLPSGMAVLVLSPGAMARAAEINEQNHYNSLLFLAANFRKNQTPYTPNILGIYLLGKIVSRIPPISMLHEITRKRAQDWYAFLETSRYPALVAEPAVRSATVITVEGPAPQIAGLKVFAQQQGIVLGNGYGAWKTTTFRIANFPAITDLEINTLKHCIEVFRTNFTV